MANFTLTPNAVNCSIAGTTAHEGSRNPYLCGFFMSQIYPSQGEHRPRSIEFVIRLISGNKASNRTNNASRSCAVVETVSHPIKGDTSLLTKTHENHTMKIYSKPTALMAGAFPIAFTSAMAEVKNV